MRGFLLGIACLRLSGPATLTLAMMHDQARPSLTGEIRPDPLDEYTYAKARLRQKVKVNLRPGKPCHQAGRMNLSTL